MRINQTIEVVHNLHRLNGSLNAQSDGDEGDMDNTQSSGNSSATTAIAEVLLQDMDIHKIINDCSNAALTAVASAATTATAGFDADRQQQASEQSGPQLQGATAAAMLVDSSITATTTNNGQLGCQGVVTAAVASAAELVAGQDMESDTNNAVADYMSDAFGELCLNALNCDNATTAPLADAAVEAYGVERNFTQFFLDGGDDNLMDYCMNHVDNITYLNISCEFELEYATPLYGFCIPFLLFVTVTANLLIVIVLSRRGMATPTNSVLMGMALCDMFTLLCPAPGLIYMLTLGNHNRPLSGVAACHAWIAFYETIPNMFHTASIWLTLALAVQRYIYVCHPPLARTWCTMPRVRKCILGIGIAAFLHQSTRFFDREITAYTILWEGQWIEVCKMGTSSWVREVVGENLYFTTYFVFRVIFVHLLPCICLVALNCLLFRAMKQAQDRRENLFRENRKKECKKLRDSNCTTLMLIVVVTVFLIVEIPLAVLTLLHIISVAFVEFLDYHLVSICILFANFALIVSYPINFAIYCGMSRQFRETFKEIFLRGSLTLPNKSVGGAASTSRYSLVNGPRTCTNETVL